ncbi:similar to Saccharomyces cerevisiae YCL016C DCC1 Subunit of a complex with Ctf8p and Ctf18p that shares some components with Replication Factor C [Maudiozyma barnettii]|mgnify:CR=1 FL=1|uniref:Similar to Saccharomyces cerevisiae YCL016C DCC1 Subunit of a complex with Ctf8p and Ctf18p that shares some components with Replication Factor C n=1 Tax=Maudiozyma barnettii TaxID=61262 RepID=A0A8H2VJH0_9SACH|nr:Dcc1p [Kazachstania barnettii]CAB4256551.1 similar to Saccharomyces cerevisiae YCL016C DCC1 Subunit of a complex with Ctf8p and Ctf18p that shares some components with Replication Factor C [Kazachstania barnettii]CAD1785154.1 similar to Saccharomyces cerevisiae YCL016C DCC1 Subunit of a complex with Ctf8p and Ctf18p that shares some components with Replication Factor C [Kazachstania barnettii]
MSINLYSKLKQENSNISYKLIELNDDLMHVLKDKDTCRGLRFKSLDNEKSHVVLCSEDKTWLVRQKDHSNMSMIMHEGVVDNSMVIDPSSLFGLPPPITDYIGFARTTYEYETIDTEGRLHLDFVPIYDGEKDFSPPKHQQGLIFEDLLKKSPCSKGEALAQWHSLGGSTIEGQVCLLSSQFISKALHVTLMSVLAESMKLNELKLKSSYEAVNKDMDSGFNPYTVEVVETVLNKFGRQTDITSQEPTWELNNSAIAKWYGIQSLKKYVNKSALPIDEFMLQWRSQFPPFFPCDIDMTMLRGHYYQPQEKQIQYFARNTLSMDPKDRFKTLFKLQSSWDLRDIEPFIEELNVKHLKIDSFIMKYARRRRVGKHYIITSRA